MSTAVAVAVGYDPLRDKSYQSTASDLYGHLDMRDVAADMGLLAPAREE